MMDSIGETILRKYMPEALTDPSKRDPVELAHRMGLNVIHEEVYNHRGVGSILFFAEGDLVAGEDRRDRLSGEYRKTKSPRMITVPANTIVVNTNLLNERTGAFAVAHECVHFYEHYLFFRLQELGNSDPRNIKTREVIVEEGHELHDPIHFMEKQADRGAYALIMPATHTEQLIRQECARVTKYRNVGEQYETAGLRIAEMLQMPHFRIRARMIQLGHYEAKGALNYVRDHMIQPFAFARDSLAVEVLTFVIWPGALQSLADKNEKLKKLLDSRRYVILYGVMLISALMFLFPLYYVLVLSISDPTAIDANHGFLLIPRRVCLDAYKLVMENKHVLTGFKNTFVYILLGVSIQYVVTILAAYALSIKELPGRRILWAFFIITMYFNGGIVPTYLLISKMGLLNKVWSITLPGAVSISFIIIMRTQFCNIPEPFKDAARMDGASHVVMLFKVMLPLTAATSAVLLLFSTVAYWNMWYEPMIYTTKRSMYPLQSVLREILIDNSFIATAGRSQVHGLSVQNTSRGTIQLMVKYAAIVLTTIPMLLLYPFVQKHFVKGILIGGIKG